VSHVERELGEILLSQGSVTATQLQSALDEQERSGTSAWKVLLAADVVSEVDLVRARATQIGMPFVDLQTRPVSPEIAGIVPLEVARRQQALVVHVADDHVVCALAEPRNHLALGEIAGIVGKKVVPAAAHKPHLLAAIERAYGAVPAASAVPAPPVPAPVPAMSGSHAPAPPPAQVPPAPSFGGGNGAGASTFGPDDLPLVESAAPEEPDPVAEVVEEERDPSLSAFLEAVIDNGASDLHITAGLPPMMRIHGELTRIKGYRRLEPDDLQQIVYSILTQKQREIFEEKLELDVSYALPGKGRFRVNVFQQRDSLGAVMRLIPYGIKTTEELGLPAAVREFANLRRGLVLVTGITGSGKSTTLAALVDVINSERHEHIMTVEDPIEFLHTHKKCVVNQREVGEDTHSFSNALKHVLRQDPDVILVGEMRDLETISTALTAAETGHLVFGTLHTQDAPQSIDRVIDVFPPHQQQQIRVQLAGTIAGVVSQQLVPTADGKGRAVAVEVLVATPAVRNLIREGKTHQIYTSMQAGGKFGMQVMDQHLAELVKKGKVKYEDALERCHKVEEFNRLCGKG
jgi:twitching motility protein PilT